MKSIVDSAKAAKAAGASVALLDTEEKNRALLDMADALIEHTEEIIKANALDMARGREKGTPEPMLDRLMLNADRIAGMAEGLRQVADLPDPVGEVMDEWTTKEGLFIQKVRVPMGVIGIIYEARPNVTADAAALAFKAGSAILLRGSSSAFESNAALVRVMRDSLQKSGISPDAICLVEDPSHEVVGQMLKLREYIDLIVPRGGAALIKNAVMNSTVPVLETGTGNCHVYIDKGTDYDTAEAIVINAKTQRTGVCNAMETLLVQEDWAKENLPRLLKTMTEKSVELHGDEKAAVYSEGMIPATESDWENEYLRMAMAVKVVPGVEDAVSHINRYGTKHTECILTPSAENAALFQKTVDAAVVNVNASTRFTDGFMFGFGAELGISTQKLHARGPMGLREITSYKYLVTGNGQVRA